jgi:hypothetical protein
MGMKKTAADQATALHEKKMAAGQYTKVGPYSVMDTTSKEIISLPPEQMERLADLKAKGKAAPTVERVARDTILDGAGDMWFPDYNKTTGKWTFLGPGGQIRTTPPEGAQRPTDSIYSDLSGINAKRLEGLYEDYDLSRDELQAANRALDLLDDPEVWTGIFADTATTLKGALVSAGVASQKTMDQVGKMEELRNLTFKFVMKNVANTKGAVSDREMALFAKASPNLQNSVQGNQRILEGVRMIAERKMEQKHFMNEQVLGKKVPYHEAEKAWDEYAKANPIFTEGWFVLPSEGDTSDTAAPRMPGMPEESLDDILKLYQ